MSVYGWTVFKSLKFASVHVSSCKCQGAFAVDCIFAEAAGVSQWRGRPPGTYGFECCRDAWRRYCLLWPSETAGALLATFGWLIVTLILGPAAIVNGPVGVYRLTAAVTLSIFVLPVEPRSIPPDLKSPAVLLPFDPFPIIGF